MPLESATFISDLNASNPTPTDLKSQGDDHLRLLKSALKTTFPNVSGAVTATHTQLNGQVGVISMWPTSAAPTGYLMCNGQNVSRTLYATLFATLGVVFGVGDGASTFALPNYNDRMPIGAGNMYAAASTGGSRDAVVVAHSHTATLTGSTAGAGGHTHSITDPGHAHGNVPFRAGDADRGTNSSLFSIDDLGVTGVALTGISINTDGAHTHTVSASGSTDSAGASATNANLPPYVGIYFIIKA